LLLKKHPLLCSSLTLINSRTFSLSIVTAEWVSWYSRLCLFLSWWIFFICLLMFCIGFFCFSDFSFFFFSEGITYTETTYVYSRYGVIPTFVNDASPTRNFVDEVNLSELRLTRLDVPITNSTPETVTHSFSKKYFLCLGCICLRVFLLGVLSPFIALPVGSIPPFFKD